MIESNLVQILLCLGFKYKKGIPSASTPGYIKCVRDSVLKVRISSKGNAILEQRMSGQGVVLCKEFSDQNLLFKKIQELEKAK